MELHLWTDWDLAAPDSDDPDWLTIEALLIQLSSWRYTHKIVLLWGFKALFCSLQTCVTSIIHLIPKNSLRFTQKVSKFPRKKLRNMNKLAINM
jgi:hypothetical protein